MGFADEDRYLIKSCETAKVMLWLHACIESFLRKENVNWIENSDKEN